MQNISKLTAEVRNRVSTARLICLVGPLGHESDTLRV